MNRRARGHAMSLRDALACGEFVVTSEVGPPKGIDITEMLETAEMLQDRVHALNVTDNQAAVMRLSTIAACVHLKQAGFEPVLQVTGRDRNRLGIQSDLLGAASFGVDDGARAHRRPRRGGRPPGGQAGVRPGVGADPRGDRGAQRRAPT